MKLQVPIVLMYSRLVIGLIVILLSIQHIDYYKFISTTLLTIGLLTDIFDGIIARRLAVSTQKIRRLDSAIDQLFFLSFTLATYIQCPDFFKSNFTKLAILIGIEGAAYLVSYVKFKKEIATHSIGAKIWTLLLFATLIEVITHCQSVTLFNFFFWIGLITRLEIIAIILTLKTWTTDVPTFYHSLKLRKGIEIKRHKLFNG
ncbi:MAG: CDP-alcohol phosphatidyltransferase family protein [Bacteroidetes bacterium]|nr:CDP-alcohol phosphatidyltransferase family protein [Bacteroidota bacterium]